MASADSYNVQTSDGAGCSQNESTGRSVEFGANVNTFTQEAEVSVMYKIELGKKKLRRNRVNCNDLYDISLRRQNLQLRREQLEIELLRVQLANAKAQNNNNNNATITSSDDW
jgi:hypothetical protein